ncbi:MAG: hypothetical protein MMC33_009516 [Icmadophila ericetorum]|nr:hypothetical protein [Icmadophila ericetorum]
MAYNQTQPLPPPPPPHPQMMDPRMPQQRPPMGHDQFPSQFGRLNLGQQPLANLNPLPAGQTLAPKISFELWTINKLIGEGNSPKNFRVMKWAEAKWSPSPFDSKACEVELSKWKATDVMSEYTKLVPSRRNVIDDLIAKKKKDAAKGIEWTLAGLETRMRTDRNGDKIPVEMKVILKKTVKTPPPTIGSLLENIGQNPMGPRLGEHFHDRHHGPGQFQGEPHFPQGHHGPPGMPPPGMHPGIHPGMQPGLQPGMHPGIPQGIRPPMHPDMHNGPPRPAVYPLPAGGAHQQGRGHGPQIVPIHSPKQHDHHGGFGSESESDSVFSDSDNDTAFTSVSSDIDRHNARYKGERRGSGGRDRHGRRKSSQYRREHQRKNVIQRDGKKVYFDGEAIRDAILEVASSNPRGLRPEIVPGRSGHPAIRPMIHDGRVRRMSNGFNNRRNPMLANPVLGDVYEEELRERDRERERERDRDRERERIREEERERDRDRERERIREEERLRLDAREKDRQLERERLERERLEMSLEWERLERERLERERFDQVRQERKRLDRERSLDRERRNYRGSSDRDPSLDREFRRYDRRDREDRERGEWERDRRERNRRNC